MSVDPYQGPQHVPAWPEAQVVPESYQRAALATVAAQQGSNGWRVESNMGTMATLVKGKPVNHLLHFLLGLFSFGCWWLVWPFIAIFGGEKRKTIQVDAYGNVMGA